MTNNNDKNLTWEETKVEHLVHDRWIDFRRSEYKFPNGKIYGPYYTYSRRDYSIIVATDEEGKYICVRQFRQGIKQVTTEFPAGGIGRSDGRDYGADNEAKEDAFLTARRELLEETGYQSSDWEFITKVPSNATISDNYANIFVARNCKRVQSQELDETEFLNVVTYTKEEIEKLIQNNEFQQCLHMLAFYMANNK